MAQREPRTSRFRADGRWGAGVHRSQVSDVTTSTFGKFRAQRRRAHWKGEDMRRMLKSIGDRQLEWM